MVNEKVKEKIKYFHLAVDRETYERVKLLAQGKALTTFLREQFLNKPDPVTKNDIALLDEKIEKMRGFMGWESIPLSARIGIKRALEKSGYYRISDDGVIYFDHEACAADNPDFYQNDDDAQE